MTIRLALEYPNVDAEALFDSFLEQFRKRGFHIEEADRVEMTINLAHDSALGFLFGLGKKRIFADFDETAEGCSVALKIKGGQQFADEVADALSKEAAVILKRYLKRREIAQERASALKPQPQPQMILMKETVHKEIVKVPCSYCGELVANTVDKCPSCGAGLR